MKRHVSTTLVTLHKRGDLREAERLYKESLTIVREVGAKTRETTSLTNLAGVKRSKGELKEAERLYDDSLSLSRMIGYRRGEAFCLKGQGSMFEGRGDSKNAERLYLKSRNIFQSIGMAEMELKISYLLGKLKDSEGQHDWAMVYFQQALEIHKQTGIKTPEWLIDRVKQGYR